MPKRITALDVLTQLRRTRRIINRTIAYLEQQERRERREAEKGQQRADDRKLLDQRDPLELAQQG